MKLSLILTVNNRPPEVSRQVAAALKLPGNQPDELVVVLDRPLAQVIYDTKAAYDNLPFPVDFVGVGGAPGWLGPARAWNAGFRAATGDTFMCISSEVVLDPNAVSQMRELVDEKTAVFGACHNSVATNLVVGAEPGLLVSSHMARPLGFIVCMPAARVRAIAGFDEAFMAGFWYDDDDFFVRLWQTGLNFLFDDRIHGTHLDHERPDLATPEGQRKIQANAALMARKHGVTSALALKRAISQGPGWLRWEHPDA
jgi:GT2 family glycosyltransferase